MPDGCRDLKGFLQPLKIFIKKFKKVLAFFWDMIYTIKCADELHSHLNK